VLRRQLAMVATPRVRRFVFIRRVRLRAAPPQIGLAMEAALTKLAVEARQDVLTYADFPALVVACAQAALAGGGFTGWQWRTLGLPPGGTAGEGVAALLTAHPLEAGAAVAALAAQGLLAPVWRSMPEPAAARLTASVVLAAGISVPVWPEVLDSRSPDEVPAPVATLLARTKALWGEALRPPPPNAEAIRAAAVLSLLRWSPGAFRTGENRIWHDLLVSLTDRRRTESVAHPPHQAGSPRPSETPVEATARGPAASRHSEPQPTETPAEAAALPEPVRGEPVADTGRPNAILRTRARPDSGPDASPAPHGMEFGTAWGGVLFLINALQRLHIEVLLDRAGSDAPTGWRLLHDLGIALGMPEDEPLATFLAAQDLETRVVPDLLAELLGDIEALYQPQGPWPLPLAQPGRLRATETHLDLGLQVTDIDIAVRLAGLDFDPGWVPWLGRVVAFHYDQLPIVFHRSG
jgi:hypothetical protein